MPAYCQTSCIKRAKSQNVNVSRLVLQLALLNPLKPGVKSSNQQFYWLQRCDLYWRFDSRYVIDIISQTTIGHWTAAENKKNTPTVLLYAIYHIDGLMQERCNSSALAMELRLTCIKPSICFSSFIECQWLHRAILPIEIASEIWYISANVYRIEYI